MLIGKQNPTAVQQPAISSLPTIQWFERKALNSPVVTGDFQLSSNGNWYNRDVTSEGFDLNDDMIMHIAQSRVHWQDDRTLKLFFDTQEADDTITTTISIKFVKPLASRALSLLDEATRGGKDADGNIDIEKVREPIEQAMMKIVANAKTIVCYFPARKREEIETGW